MMRDINDDRIYDLHEKYQAEVKIFYEVWKQSTLMYDKIEINSIRDKEVSKFYYEIGNVSITIGLSNNCDILYNIKLNEEEFVNKVIIPAEITTFTDLHTFLFKYFDELLYAVYLAAKDKTYKVKKPKDIHNIFVSFHK